MNLGDGNIKYKEIEGSDSKSQSHRFLILHNDEHNLFDFVVKTLIDVCHHEPEQAEQCTLIVHYKGKCDIKKGSYNSLKPFKETLINKGLTVTID